MTRRTCVVGALTLALLAGCSGQDDQPATGADTTTAAGAFAGDTAAFTEDTSAATETTAASGARALDGSALADAVPVALLDDHIIRSGAVRVVVAAGRFDAAWGEVGAIANSLGGLVQDSQRSTSDYDPGGLTAGFQVLRVPAARFDDAVDQVGRIGTLTSLETTGQTVTAQYTDLESRLRHWEAQETFLLGLLGQAVTVADSLTVRGELNIVQLEIETVRGQLNVLDDQLALSTLRVELGEEGAEAPVVEPTEPSWADHYIRTPIRALGQAAGVLLAVALFLAPFALLLLAAALTGYGIRRRNRASVTAQAQPAEPPEI